MYVSIVNMKIINLKLKIFLLGQSTENRANFVTENILYYFGNFEQLMY